MGTRGPIKTLARQFPVRLDDSLYAQIKILSSLECMSMATLIRTLLKEALRARGPIPALEGPTMSRQIDLSKPLSDEDEQYLITRGRTLEQEVERQAHMARIADTVVHDEEAVSEQVAFLRRNHGRV